MAVGYGWLERAEFDPSEGITLLIVSQKVRIKGRNLNSEVHPSVRLFEGALPIVCRGYAKPTDQRACQAGDRDTVIESVAW